jgi:hypothetical protein
MYFLQGFWYKKQKTVEVEPKTAVVPAVEADITVRETASGQFEIVF